MPIKETSTMTELEKMSVRNTNIQFLQQLCALPLGITFPFRGETAPNGFALCQGQSLSKTTYPDLFAVIGYTYGGSGDNFNLPDLGSASFVWIIKLTSVNEDWEELISQSYDSASAMAMSGVAIAGALANKVDKVTGKDLSTNDYTNADKAKVSTALQPSNYELIETITVGADTSTITRTQDTEGSNYNLRSIVVYLIAPVCADAKIIQIQLKRSTDSSWKTFSLAKNAAINATHQLAMIATAEIKGGLMFCSGEYGFNENGFSDTICSSTEGTILGESTDVSGIRIVCSTGLIPNTVIKIYGVRN